MQQRRLICLVFAALILLTHLLPGPMPSAHAASDYVPYSMSLSPFYQTLTSLQRGFFDSVYDAVYVGKETVEVPSGISGDDAWMIVNILFNECPELCALDKWSYHSPSGASPYMSLTYKRSISLQREFIQEISQLARQFHSVEDVYVWVCQTFTYGDSSADPTAMFAYDALKKGFAVCNGYAQTMALLCHFAGLECSYIHGKANGAEHAWNIVRVGDVYTLVDATWDDGGSSPRFQWYGLSDAEMGESHVPYPEHTHFPPCQPLKEAAGDAQAISFNGLNFTFKQGDTGDVVRRLQQRLIDLGYLSGRADGIYGDGTRRAVAAFQKNNAVCGVGISLGVATEMTQALLYSSLAVPASSRAKTSTVFAKDAFTIYVGRNYGVTRSGSRGELDFIIQNNQTSQPIVAFTLRYWGTDANDRVVYPGFETVRSNLNIRPGAQEEFRIQLAEWDTFRQVKTLKWNIIDLCYANGEVAIATDPAGVDAFRIPTYNEPVF